MVFVNGYPGEEWLEPITGAVFFPFLCSGIVVASSVISAGGTLKKVLDSGVVHLVLKSFGLLKPLTSFLNGQVTVSIVLGVIWILLFILNAVAMFRASAHNSMIALFLFACPCICSLYCCSSSFSDTTNQKKVERDQAPCRGSWCY